MPSLTKHACCAADTAPSQLLLLQHADRQVAEHHFSHVDHCPAAHQVRQLAASNTTRLQSCRH
jgi:hypothetical protein